MTKLERLLRGDKATYMGCRVVKFIDLGERDSDGDRYALIYLNRTQGLFDVKYFREDTIELGNSYFLEPEKPRTIEDGLKEGDIIVDNNGCKRLILGICGKIIIPSEIGDFKKATTMYTAKELISRGYKLYQPEQSKPTKKMTVAEVSKLAGQTVEITE